MNDAEHQNRDRPPGSDLPARPTADYIDHVKKVNDVFYDQIKIADQKAAYIFTFMLAFLITSQDGRAAFDMETYAGQNMVVGLVSGVLAIAASVSILAAIFVVLPRRGTDPTTLFWGGWDSGRAGFLAASASADPSFVFQQLLANVDSLSGIAKAKYRCVSIAFQALTIMVVAYLLRLLLIS